MSDPRDERIAALVKAATALADRVDATSECDHTRIVCEEIGCIGAEVRAVRQAVAALRSIKRRAGRDA